MTLLTTIFAAAAATLIWYTNEKARAIRIGILCWLFWGASLMWLVDAVFAYAEEGAACFTPAPEALLNDLCLGLSVIALALLIWIAVILIRDPLGILRDRLRKKH